MTNEQTEVAGLLDKSGLAKKLNCTIHQAAAMAKRLKLPTILLSKKEPRWYWPDVLAHLRKLRKQQ